MTDKYFLRLHQADGSFEDSTPVDNEADAMSLGWEASACIGGERVEVISQSDGDIERVIETYVQATTADELWQEWLKAREAVLA